MALSVQADSKQDSMSQAPEREEGFLHFIAHGTQWALRWCIILCILGIVMIMVASPGFYFVAVIPAAVMLMCAILLVVASAFERKSDPVAHDLLEHRETAIDHDLVDDMAEAQQLQPQAAVVVKRETFWGVAIIGTAVLAALFIAYWFVPTPLFAIGSLVVFAYMLFICAPFLLGAFNDDIEDTTHRLDEQEE